MTPYKPLRYTIWHATLTKNLARNFARGNAPLYYMCEYVTSIRQFCTLTVNRCVQAT